MQTDNKLTGAEAHTLVLIERGSADLMRYLKQNTQRLNKHVDVYYLINMLEAAAKGARSELNGATASSK